MTCDSSVHVCLSSSVNDLVPKSQRHDHQKEDRLSLCICCFFPFVKNTWESPTFSDMFLSVKRRQQRGCWWSQINSFLKRLALRIVCAHWVGGETSQTHRNAAIIEILCPACYTNHNNLFSVFALGKICNPTALVLWKLIISNITLFHSRSRWRSERDAKIKSQAVRLE